MMKYNDPKLLAIELRNEITSTYRKQHPLYAGFSIVNYLGTFDNYVAVTMDYPNASMERIVDRVIYLLG